MKQPTEKYCYECAAVLPRTATVCGSCLASQPELPQAAAPVTPPPAEHHWDLSHVLLGIGAVMLVGMGANAFRAPPAPPSPPPRAPASAAALVEEVEAWAEARKLVAHHLRAPTNVAFSSEHSTTRVAPGTYEISSSFEAANSHGTIVRTNWTAVVARQPDGWRLERLDARN